MNRDTNIDMNYEIHIQVERYVQFDYKLWLTGHDKHLVSYVISCSVGTFIHDSSNDTCDSSDT